MIVLVIHLSPNFVSGASCFYPAWIWRQIFCSTCIDVSANLHADDPSTYAWTYSDIHILVSRPLVTSCLCSVCWKFPHLSKKVTEAIFYYLGHIGYWSLYNLIWYVVHQSVFCTIFSIFGMVYVHLFHYSVKLLYCR